MKVLPATLGASDQHYRRLGVSRDRIELWKDGMRTDGGKGTYEWWYFDAYLNDGSKLAITLPGTRILRHRTTCRRAPTGYQKRRLTGQMRLLLDCVHQPRMQRM
jgi:hypothetical protein